MIFTLRIELKEEHLIAEAREWLDNHFKGSSFSLCLIDDMLRHLNIEGVKRSRIYTYLHSLHCVNFDKMKPETLAKCKEICYDLIGDPVEVIQVDEFDLV